MDNEVSPRSATSTAPEDLFAELFTQVFGIENTRLLAPQYPVEDIYGGSRYVDFALKTIDERVAFEIDGLTVARSRRYGRIADTRICSCKQNSLIHQGWRVFRWTDRQIANEPEQVKEQLALFLERIPGLLTFDDFLPKQHGEVLELRPHQEEAIQVLGTTTGRGQYDRTRHSRPRGGQDRDSDHRRTPPGRPDPFRGAHPRARASSKRSIPQTLARRHARASFSMRNARPRSITSSARFKA